MNYSNSQRAGVILYPTALIFGAYHLKTEEFLEAMNKVAEESFRVLKEGKICAVMMGDIRKNGKVVPLGFRTMEVFLNTGFQSKEIIIKEQYNCKSTAYWKSKKNKFLLLAHEYIFVFQK